MGFIIIIVEEENHIARKSYQKALEILPDAFVLGVTAIPERLDKKDILKGKQPLFSKNIIVMVVEGYLCNFKPIAIQTHISLENEITSMGDSIVGELNTPVTIH